MGVSFQNEDVLRKAHAKTPMPNPVSITINLRR